MFGVQAGDLDLFDGDDISKVGSSGTQGGLIS